MDPPQSQVSHTVPLGWVCVPLGQTSGHEAKYSTHGWASLVYTMLFAIHCPGGKVEVGPGVVVVVVVGVVGSGQATIRSKGPKQLNNSMIFWRIFGETQPPECYNQCYIHNRWDVNPKLLEYRFIGLSRIFVGCRTSFIKFASRDMWTPLWNYYWGGVVYFGILEWCVLIIS